MHVGFDGANGWPFKSVQKVLMDCGELKSMSFPNFISYLTSLDPDMETRVINIDSRYIFFRATASDEGASGAMGQILSPGRSVAIDP